LSAAEQKCGGSVIWKFSGRRLGEQPLFEEAGTPFDAYSLMTSTTRYGH